MGKQWGKEKLYVKWEAMSQRHRSEQSKKKTIQDMVEFLEIDLRAGRNYSGYDPIQGFLRCCIALEGRLRTTGAGEEYKQGVNGIIRFVLNNEVESNEGFKLMQCWVLAFTRVGIQKRHRVQDIHERLRAKWSRFSEEIL